MRNVRNIAKMGKDKKKRIAHNTLKTLEEQKKRVTINIRLIGFPIAFLVILFAILKFHRSGEYIVFAPEIKTHLNKDEVSALHGGIEAFLTKYNRPAHRQILVSKARPGDWIKMRSDGRREETLAISSPGHIRLILETLTTSSFQNRLTQLRHIGLHESAHACKAEEPRAIATPFKLSDGAEAIRLHGFNVLVRFPNGEESGFRLIEEGIAEMLAAKADSNYTVGDASYHRLGNLSIILVNALEMRPEEVQDHLERNDLCCFVNGILGRHRQGCNPEDIISVMNAYQQVANGSEPIAVARELLGD